LLIYFKINYWYFRDNFEDFDRKLQRRDLNEKTLHFFSHWTFREGLQALRCEKRCRVFLGEVSGEGGDVLFCILHNFFSLFEKKILKSTKTVIVLDLEHGINKY